MAPGRRPTALFADVAHGHDVESGGARRLALVRRFEREIREAYVEAVRLGEVEWPVVWLVSGDDPVGAQLLGPLGVPLDDAYVFATGKSAAASTLASLDQSAAKVFEAPVEGCPLYVVCFAYSGCNVFCAAMSSGATPVNA